MFCPKCSSILMPKKENDKQLLVCSCGYKTGKEAVIREKIKKKERKIEVVEKELTVLPKTDAECPKCHHRIAYYWEQQMRAADEAATKFLKCEKCGHTWREYD